MSELKRYHDDKDIGLVERKDGSWMRSERCIEEIAKLKAVIEELNARLLIATDSVEHLIKPSEAAK